MATAWAVEVVTGAKAVMTTAVVAAAALAVAAVVAAAAMLAQRRAMPLLATPPNSLKLASCHGCIALTTTFRNVL